jgi:hypothetical protein
MGFRRAETDSVAYLSLGAEPTTRQERRTSQSASADDNPRQAAL